MICFLSWFGMEKSNFQDCLNAIFIYLFDLKFYIFKNWGIMHVWPKILLPSNLNFYLSKYISYDQICFKQVFQSLSCLQSSNMSYNSYGGSHPTNSVKHDGKDRFVLSRLYRVRMSMCVSLLSFIFHGSDFSKAH